MYDMNPALARLAELVPPAEGWTTTLLDASVVWVVGHGVIGVLSGRAGWSLYAADRWSPVGRPEDVRPCLGARLDGAPDYSCKTDPLIAAEALGLRLREELPTLFPAGRL